ncbi:cytochrome P450 [Penicillium citrinum]|uniref:Cytochrome P450 monooxygenase pnltC n=1 Tax=Penicillium citrinum TaxID=5077 RepID=PNLTC_PENCI|nr:cytochrome P450 [Penicillium citrinum]KAJ5220818.1 cytochrome P450 [Penicillium citrinum]
MFGMHVNGDVVRIAPNDLVFLTPQAYTDIYTSTIDRKPAFIKSHMLDTGDKHEGLPSERDLDVHRALRKKMSPEFSPRALKKFEPVIHEHVDDLIDQLEMTGKGAEGVDAAQWFEWLFCDIAGSTTLNHKFRNVQSGQAQPLLKAIQVVGKWLTVKHVLQRFPLIYPFSFVCMPPSVGLSFYSILSETKSVIRKRIQNKNDLKRQDFLTGMVAEDRPVDFLVSQASHLVFDHYESSSPMTAAVCFLLKYPTALRKLQQEVRSAFPQATDMTDAALQELPWLHAVLEETLRLHTNVPYGLSRFSPGATVDGHYVAKGVEVHSAAYATTHSPRYFNKPYEFHPERWLPPTDPAYDSTFDDDDRQAFRPFSIGTRNCLGQNMGYLMLRLVLARLVQHYDWELLSPEVDWDRDLRLWAVWDKPCVKVRFTLAKEI